MIVRKLMVLLIFAAISSFAKEEILFANGENVKTKLRKSEYYGDLGYLSARVDNIFESVLDTSLYGFYIEMGKWDVLRTEKLSDGRVGYSSSGILVAYFPLNSNIMESYFWPGILECSDTGIGKCIKCLKKIARNKQDEILKKCYGKILISDSLKILLKKFFDEDRLSLRKSTIGNFYSKQGENCYENFKIIYYEKSGGKRIIDMVPPGCIDNEMKKNKIINEYIYLYDQFYSIFHSNFEECRWENFGDKKQLDKCRSY